MRSNPREFIQQHWEQILPFVICLALPWLAIINSSSYWEGVHGWRLLVNWLLISGLLLLLWHSNAFFFKRPRPRLHLLKLLLANLAVMGLAIGLQVWLPDMGLPLAQQPSPWLVIFRLGMASVLFIAIQGSFDALRQNERLKTENFALQTENYRAQLDQLKKQVNPHFLFNSLSTLQNLIRSGDAHSEEFVHKLSEVYRQLLQTRESHVISLREELDFLKAYLYLLQGRHDDALNVRIQAMPAALDFQLPTFGLQLLVENCVKHNVISASRPLTIQISQTDPATITVRNNRQPKKNVPSLGVGLDNLRKRYDLLGIEAGVQLEESPDEFSVTLKLC
jgi:two-component system, LytTR family, sensor kinase